MVKVAVLGAGINGVTCALRIKEKYKNFEVVIISNGFTPDTTGDGSGGLWYPYLCGNTSGSQLNQWGGETYKFLHDLWLEGGYNVSFMPIYVLYREKQNEFHPEWANRVYGFQELNGKQLDYLSRLYSVRYASGHTFSTFVVRPPNIIEHLFRSFQHLGGVTLEATINSLDDHLLDEYDIVVNCTGLGSRTIVPDEKIFPVRGQISRVIAPWLNTTVIDQDSGHYIIPNAKTCVLGGTHQEYDFNTKVDKNDLAFIVNGCISMIPSLQHSEISQTWVGLRPARDEIRIQVEHRNGKLYIHNYGHGGSGFTLFWGCGSEVLQLLDNNLNTVYNPSTKCKL